MDCLSPQQKQINSVISHKANAQKNTARLGGGGGREQNKLSMSTGSVELK